MGRKKTLRTHGKAEQGTHTNKVLSWAQKLRGWQCWRAQGQQAGQLRVSCWGTRIEENSPSRYLTKLAWPEDCQETSFKLCFVGSGKGRTCCRGWQWQLCLLWGPGSSEDAYGQTESWVPIYICKVRDFKHYKASGKASLPTVCNQEQGLWMLLQSVPPCTTGNSTRTQRYRMR